VQKAIELLEEREFMALLRISKVILPGIFEIIKC